MCACSGYKKYLDPVSRYSYIEYSYQNLAHWMTVGTADELALKILIHRYLALPSTLPDSISYDDAQELLKQFAFQYVDALLTYCSDKLKEHYFPLQAKTTSQFKNLPLGKVCSPPPAPK